MQCYTAKCVRSYPRVSVVNISLGCSAGSWSQRPRLERIFLKCQAYFDDNSQKGTCYYFIYLWGFFTMRHFHSHSSFFLRSPRWRVTQDGRVPHHEACSGLDESPNYLMATVGAFRRRHLPSLGETGRLTVRYAYSRRTKQCHSQCAFNLLHSSPTWHPWTVHLQALQCKQ